MNEIDSMERLVNEFSKLPSVGKKTAQRYAYFLLTMDESEVKDFADAMISAKEKIHYCRICANFTDKEICEVCAKEKKDPIICVVKEPKDVTALEKVREFNGSYHVLHGVINPLEGKGPNDINIRSLLSRVVDEKFDYAIGFMEGWANEYVASSKINAKKKFVWIHPQYKSCFLIPEIDRKIFKKVDGIALISEDCMTQFLEYFGDFEKKVRIIPNIISANVIKRKAQQDDIIIRKTDINFCTVSRCDIQVKGLDRLLKCFYDLKKEKKSKGVLWHFIGGGKELEYFRNEIKRLDMEDVIALYGDMLNPLPYLKQMDVFILASRYEGKPVSVTEAQILGLPCIVTNYESAHSQVQNNRTGLVVNNDYESIYRAVESVVDNPSILVEWKNKTKIGAYSNELDIKKFYDFLGVDVLDVDNK